MAAVLATGDDAVLSHRSAAALWRIRASARPYTEVTVARARRPLSRIQVHRSGLRVDEITILRGVPVTTVPRTILDLAAVVPRRQLERALEEAEVRRLLDPLSLDDLLERHPRRPGNVLVKAILGERGRGSSITRSELEERFLSFLDRAGLPPPEVNVQLEVGGRGFECDCVWRGPRLVVELDGYAVHSTRAAYERDRARDRALCAGSWRVVRVTWRQLHEGGRPLAADLRALLSGP
jgi:very-short-patch-repair endonuclease